MKTILSISLGIATLGLAWSGAANEPEPTVIVLAEVRIADSRRAPTGSATRSATTDHIDQGESNSTVEPPSEPPVFVPRVRHGAPASRVGGATRARDTAVAIRTLVPEIDEAALTMRARPNLHWYLSGATSHPVNFTLLDPDVVEPMVDVMIEGPFEAGFHSVSLIDYDVQLAPGKRYEWFVAVVPDVESRSADAVARGAISRITDAALASQIGRAAPGEVAGLLASSGIWYEALDELNQRVRQDPTDSGWRTRRREMLEQVGLVISRDR